MPALFKKNLSFIHLLFLKKAGGIIILVFLSIFSLELHAQITPSEGSILNYRIIGFSFPAKQETTKYIVEIAGGNFKSKKDFATHVTQKISSDKNKIVIEVPCFDSAYTWRVIYNGNSSAVKSSKL